MNYDAIAASQIDQAIKPRTKRLGTTTDYFHKKLKDEQRKANTEQKKEADTFRTNWAKDKYPAEHFGAWKDLVIPSSDDLQHMVSLIAGSWAIQFTFTLATPYLSKGIEAFDLLDNPIIRDKVYEVPIVPASSWKGGLRAAAAIAEITDGKDQPIKIEDTDRANRILRLFGNAREADSGFRAGRLHCFPTGFQKTTCEVINPHDRARRVGTNPILLECVPAGQDGTFTVLYVPFGEESDPATCGADLALCAAAIKALLVEWGIGAKKSNGNGLAKDEPMPISYYPHKPETSPPPPKPAPKTLTSFSQLQDIDLGQVRKPQTPEQRRETFSGIITKIVPEMVEQLIGGKR